MDLYATSHFSNQALRQDLRTRSANDCRSTAILLSRIGEFDERQLYLEEACDSMHSYCTRELHWCDGTASWRIYAARAARRFPVLFDLVADGRLHLTAVVMLRKYLTSGNVDELVAAATHKSRTEIEQLIVSRFPKRDLPERLEALPPPLTMAGPPGVPHWPANVDGPIPPAAPPAPGSVPAYWPANTDVPVPPGFPPAAPPAPGSVPAYWPANTDLPVPPGFSPASGPIPQHPPASVEIGRLPAASLPMGSVGQYWPANTAALGPRGKMTPLAPERFGLQVTLDQATHDLLQRARSLMGHQNPTGEMVPVLKSALRLLVDHLEKRKFAAATRRRPPAEQGSTAGDIDAPAPTPGDASAHGERRHIPAAVKRAVWEGDGGRCTFVSEAGTRCPARNTLEFDHEDPFARGGMATIGNVRLLCRAHNAYAAERVLGAEFMDHKRREARLARR